MMEIRRSGVTPLEACFSGPAIALLGVVSAAIQSTIVTLFWLLYKSQAARAARAEAKEDWWRQIAVRGAVEIKPMAEEVRQHVRDRWPDVAGPEYLPPGGSS